MEICGRGWGEGGEAVMVMVMVMDRVSDGVGLQARFVWGGVRVKDRLGSGSGSGVAAGKLNNYPSLRPRPIYLARYAQYLSSVSYAPADDTNFLREWPDWRAAAYPPGNETVPVTGVSLGEARAFCEWAGGRFTQPPHPLPYHQPNPQPATLSLGLTLNLKPYT